MPPATNGHAHAHAGQTPGQVPNAQEFMQWSVLSTEERPQRDDIKVYMGFCVENCLAGHLMIALGEGGMWG